MTPAAFRVLALKMPEAIESAHMGHPDFRVGGKIFATLSPDGAWGMVKLTPEQQGVFVRAEPGMFEAFDNAWGRMGCTKVHLKVATKGAVEPAMAAARENVSAGVRKSPAARKKGKSAAEQIAIGKGGSNYEKHELHEKAEGSSHATTADHDCVAVPGRCPTRIFSDETTGKRR